MFEGIHDHIESSVSFGWGEVTGKDVRSYIFIMSC